jgi:hypothetical protein
MRAAVRPCRSRSHHPSRAGPGTTTLTSTSGGRAATYQASALAKHQWLLRRVWGRGYAEESHYLRVYVRALRRKLGDAAAAPTLILTEPGVGYRWIAEPSN